jgi:hypothetical protein
MCNLYSITTNQAVIAACDPDDGRTRRLDAGSAMGMRAKALQRPLADDKLLIVARGADMSVA